MAVSLIERQLGLRNGAEAERLGAVHTVEEACDKGGAHRGVIDSPAQNGLLIDYAAARTR